MTQLVTGAGAVASVGEGVDEVFRALCAGTSGRGELRGFDRDRYRARHAYEIDDRPAEGGDIPGRATAWLLRAVAPPPPPPPTAAPPPRGAGGAGRARRAGGAPR
ncbi:hypothetical protein ACFV1F_10675, partial [Streptomyces sp. NPDC059590]